MKALVSLGLLVFTGSQGCTDAGLQAVPEEVPYVDDQLAMNGEFCTSEAEAGVFPVKLLIVMDQSASLQCTDPSNSRLTAMNLAGSVLDAQPNILFGVIGFSSWVRTTEFSPDWSSAAGALMPQNSNGGSATDYQGSLSTVLRYLEHDMITAGISERARTRYVILFVSDGAPEPQCRAGCDDGDTPPDSLHDFICNLTEEELRNAVPDEDEYIEFTYDCPELNSPAQIMQRVQDITSLGEAYGVGEITFNTIFLFAPQEVVDARCGGSGAAFGYVRDVAEPLMRGMAEEGGGVFRDVNTQTEIDFLDFDFQSLVSPYQLVHLYTINTNAIPDKTGFLVDSDGDGLDDAYEFANHLDRLRPDSDGDGYSDLFETVYATKGFDPADAKVPALGCANLDDRDRDGLRVCEEAFLGLDDTVPDFDGDRIPDGLELRYRLDPSQADTKIDHDLDGVMSGEEIALGTNPQIANDEKSLVNKLRYAIDPKPVSEKDITCSGVETEGITLVTTLARQGDPKTRGLNRIMMYAVEQPANAAAGEGHFFVACVEARYLGETFKDPPSGLIKDIPAQSFVDMRVFDPAVHCIQLGAPDPEDQGGGV